MALTNFYGSAADCAMAQDMISRDPDLYIEKYHIIGKAVYAVATTGIASLTPAVSPSWGVNDFLSTLNSNLLVVDDNGAVCSGKVSSNTGDAVLFSIAGMLLESDESTPGTFTAATTYCYAVLTPGASVYGNFFGQIKDSELNITDESNKFESRRPKRLLHKDPASRMMEITIPFVQRSDTDFLSLYGLETFGSQTSQFKYAVGSTVASDNYGWRLTAVNYDVHNRLEVMRMRKIKFDMTGNWFNREDGGYLSAPLHGDLLSDEFYADGAQYFDIKRAD